MPTVDKLLASLADAARGNQKGEFDRLERELLAHYEGGFDGMPKEIYERYLDVDRHWPITVDGSTARDPARTLEVRVPTADLSWLKDLAVRTDRSLSAVVAQCLETVRGDPSLEARVSGALERGRKTSGD